MAKFVELLLTVLQYQAEGALTLLDVLLSHPQDLRRGGYPYARDSEWQWFSTNWADAYRNRQQFYKTLNNLKRQGLVKKAGKPGSAKWFLTKRGKERLRIYQEQRFNPYLAASTAFEKPQGNGIIIITFDIPESVRKKRDWVRLCLVEMGFEMLQKSVWVARGREVPEEFVHALRERNLLGCVHIFSIDQKGTLKLGNE